MYPAMSERTVAAMAKTMNAIVQDSYGTVPEEVLHLAEVARPTIGESEVLVKVRAASVDRGTWHIMTGLPYAIRLAGFGVRKPRQLNPGRSLSGTVEAIGDDVTRFKPGDEVFGTCDGSFAEFASARVGRLALKPTNLSFEKMAAIPVSGLAALQAVRDKARVQAGDKVLITGASGGVGTFAVQIAKAFGATVTGVCSTAKVDLVSAVGADRVIDYMGEDFIGGERYDVILDRQVRANLLSPLVSQKLGSLMTSENAADLAVLRDLVQDGTVAPTIDMTYSLSEVPVAIGYVQEGHARGKVVVAV